jgi:hypothetical protein
MLKPAVALVVALRTKLHVGAVPEQGPVQPVKFASSPTLTDRVTMVPMGSV